jgi:hypothetical protein
VEERKPGFKGYTIMILGTGLTGLAFSIVAALLLGNLMKEDGAGFGALIGGMLGFVVGYPVGTMAGILVFKKLLRRHGSLLLGFIGCILGVVLTIGLAEPLNLNIDPNLLFGFFFLLIPLMGTIGFYLRG